MLDYIDRFEAFLNEVDNQDEKSLITYFRGGLSDDLRRQLKITRPNTLLEAFATATVYEAHLDRSIGSIRSGVKQTIEHHSFLTNTSSVPTTVATKESLIKTPPTGGQQIPIVRWGTTLEERRAHSAKGLCWYCEEVFRPGHQCKGRMFRLDADNDCLIEMVDDDQQTSEAEVVDAEPTEISLQALSGSYNSRTMQLIGSIRGRDLPVLIDGGSTHCFIQDSVAYKLGLGLKSLPEFSVFIDSGEFLVCIAVCRQVTIMIQEAEVQTDLFVLAMGGVQIWY